MEYLSLVGAVLSQLWETRAVEILLLVILGISIYRINVIEKELKLIKELIS